MSGLRLILAALLVASLAPAEWLPIGPYGGIVQTIALDPSSPDRLYAAEQRYPAYPSCFTSTDAGRSWHPAGTFPVWDVWGMLVDPHDGSRVYARSRGDEFVRSTDAGASWHLLLLSGTPRSLTIDPAIPGRIYAAGKVEVDRREPAVFISTDFGGSWTETRLDSAAGEAWSVACDPLHPGVVYVGGDSGRLYRSADSGRTWLPRNDGLPPGQSVWCLAICPADPAVILAGTDDGVFRTLDAGLSWDPSPGPWRVADLAFGSAEPEVVYARARDSVERVFVSIDTGATWNTCPVDTTWAATSRLLVDPRASAVAYLNTRAGVLKTTDRGRSWDPANHGLRTADVYTIGTNPRDPDNFYVAANNCRVFRTDDGGRSWVRTAGFWCIENGMCCGIVVAPLANGDRVYALEGSG